MCSQVYNPVKTSRQKLPFMNEVLHRLDLVSFVDRRVVPKVFPYERIM